MENPFTLTFGKSPRQYISQPVQKREIIDTFTAENPSQQAFIITGVRGSGKTVLMTDVASELNRLDNWIVLELNPELDLLNSMAAKLSSINWCADIFRCAKINLSFLGFGVEISGEPAIRDIETALVRMLEAISKKGKRVLIAIDEASNNSRMRILAGSFQIFVRQNLPVFLLMTGLYENISELQDEKDLTFLYRAPKIKLQPLNLTAISNKYKEIFEIDDNIAKNMAKATSGYPFAFQVLGYLCWEYKTFDEHVLNEYAFYLEEYVYNKIWSELSNRDKLLAYGIATAKTQKVSDIKHSAGMTANEFNPYRMRLIKKGLVSGNERGSLHFILPMFDKFVVNNTFFEQ